MEDYKPSTRDNTSFTPATRRLHLTMRTCPLLLGLLTVILAEQVRSEDLVPLGALSSQVFVPFGESVLLNCSTPFPNETSYDTRLQKSNPIRGPNWYAVEVVVDDWENSTAYCIFKDIESPTIVMAYALPSNVTVNLQTRMEEGKDYTITCMVHEVAPFEYLTINIIRGTDVINSHLFDGPHVVNKRTARHAYTFTANRSDHLMNFSCEAVLRLTPEPFTVKSPEINVQTYTLPEDPVIIVEKWIEAGTIGFVECLLDNAFPRQDINLEMFIEDTPIDATYIWSLTKGTAKRLAELNETRLGVKTISCKSRVLTLSRETAVNVTFYERPTVSFALSSDIVGLEENVTATCNITNEHPEDYGLFISVDGKEERRVQTPTLTHTFTASRRTPSLPVICTAYIIGNVTISNASIRILEVHYPPKFNESLCPSTVHLVEGETQFSCDADGNPRPTVECYANGHYINGTVPARREMSGNYTCVATNQIGNGTKSGIVHLPPYDHGWIIAIAVIVGVLIIIAIIASVLYSCWRSGRRGFYELLLPGRHHGHKNGNIPSPVPITSTTGV